MMERITHNLSQGSDEWHQFRAMHFGASEAAAMLGLSKYTTRSELLRAKSGAEYEISESLQTVFDRGHETESLARPLAEEIIGELLYPVTCSYGKLSASSDGLNMDGGIAFEHKQYNAELFASIELGNLPDEHQPQCQQVMLVTGATKLLFVCSDGTRECFAWMLVKADPVWQARLHAGWAQFADDLAAYIPREAVVTPIAAPVRDLPAIRYQLNGLALTSNLSEFRKAALVLVEDSKRELTTDEDFVNCHALNKAFEFAENKCELLCKQVLSEIADVDKFTRDLTEVKELIRQARLNGEKKVAARKEAIKLEIISNGRAAILDHVASLNKRIGRDYMPIIPADFNTATKGRRTIASLHDAVDTELARAKIQANEIAGRIQINLAALNAVSADFPQLFPDASSILCKSADDFNNLVKVRVQSHMAAEEKRVENARVASETKRQLEEQAIAREAEAGASKAESVSLEESARIASEVQALKSRIEITGSLAALVANEKALVATERRDLRAAIQNTIADFTHNEMLDVLNFAIAVRNKRAKAA